MRKRNKRQHSQQVTETTAVSGQKMEAFTFGEPSPVLDRRDILDYVECITNGRWYEPPVSFTGLAKSLRAAVHHSSPIYVKRSRSRISAASCLIFWCSATPFLKNA